METIKYNKPPSNEELGKKIDYNQYTVLDSPATEEDFVSTKRRHMEAYFAGTLPFRTKMDIEHSIKKDREVKNRIPATNIDGDTAKARKKLYYEYSKSGISGKLAAAGLIVSTVIATAPTAYQIAPSPQHWTMGGVTQSVCMMIGAGIVTTIATCKASKAHVARSKMKYDNLNTQKLKEGKRYKSLPYQNKPKIVKALRIMSGITIGAAVVTGAPLGLVAGFAGLVLSSYKANSTHEIDKHKLDREQKVKEDHVRSIANKEKGFILRTREKLRDTIKI